MMKSFAFLVAFTSTCILVQGIDQETSGSQCYCCDQCDQSAKVSKLLLDISNLLVDDDSVNATSTPSTNTIGVDHDETTTNPATTEHSSTSETPSSTLIPFNTEIHSTSDNPISSQAPPTTEILPTTTQSPSTTVTPTTTSTPATINYSSEIRDSQETSIAVNPLPVPDSSKSSESFAAAEPIPSVTDSIINPSTTASPFTKTAVHSSTKMSVCPENCYLDITGVYCNCYQPAEKVKTDS